MEASFAKYGYTYFIADGNSKRKDFWQKVFDICFN